MSADELRDIFHRIGSSTKRAGAEELRKCPSNIQRPIIGKIGIGIMAVSQICDTFAIISKKKTQRTYFKANVDLRQFEKDEAYLGGEGRIALGVYNIEEMECPDEEIHKSYMRIVMQSLKKGFRQTLADEYDKQITRIKEESSGEMKFERVIESFQKVKDFKSLSTYDYMLWELGILCPTQYPQVENTIFPAKKYINADMERLRRYKFGVSVDGLELKKPILFSKNEQLSKQNEDYKVYLLPDFDEVIEGEKLKFHGYIYSQRVKIRPTELQGVLIRIKDVAIGSYDKTLLKYRREEGPIFSMISGEIFVEHGLENALNIDRNSFNETHPHYQKLRFELHHFIKTEVVKDIRDRSRIRRKAQKKQEINTELKSLSDKIKNDLGISISFQIKEMESDQPYTFSKGRLLFFTKSKGWAKAENVRILQMKAVTALVISKYFPQKVDLEELMNRIVLGR
jgi:hypothetical protein